MGQNGPLDFGFENFAHGVGIQGGPERSILHYCAYLSLIFIKVQYVQIVLRATQTLDVLISSTKNICLTSVLPDNLSAI